MNLRLCQYLVDITFRYLYNPYMELFAHQKEAVTFALSRGGNAAIFHEPGLGKTRTTLEIYSALKATNPDLHLLVVCPLSLINSAWGEDTAKFTDFSFSTHKNLKAADIVAVNYETLISKKHLDAIKSMLRCGDWMCVVDESSRLKNFKSVTTKTLLTLVPLFKHRLVLSGTPMPNSEQELWGQMRFVNDAILPASFFAFRNIYFHLGRGNQTMPHPTGKIDRQTMMTLFQRGWKYQITKQKREELMRKIAPQCDWKKKSDAIDLPEQIDQIREVTLSDSERKAYRDMEKFLVVELEDEYITATAALAKIMKMRQLSSGFAYNQIGAICRFGKSKLSELSDVLDELGQQQVIIWVQFHAEIEAISEMLKESHKTFATLYAETEDREVSISDFQNNRVQYLIAHPRSAAHGLTFVNASTAVYFSLDYSYEAYEQSRNRIHRIGQSRSCLYIHLIASNTIDRDVYSVVRKKATLQEVVTRYARKLSKEAVSRISQDGSELVGSQDK